MKPLTILITGATAGIGRSTALHFARLGHRVFATGRREAALSSLRVEAAGTPLETLPLDVTSAASIAHAKSEIDRLTDGYGVDVLVNNAGYGFLGPVEEVSDEELRKQYDTNVFGLMAMTRAFVPAMRARGNGRVINVSSIGGRVTLPFMGAYNSTKYAVESLSDALRNELSPFGVHVSLIEPGVIKTEFTEVAMQSMNAPRSPDSPYAPMIARARALEHQSNQIAADPIVITRAIVRAATARNPRARYVAPWFAAAMLFFLPFLPTRVVDFFMRAATGLRVKRGVRALPEVAPVATF